MTNKYNLLLMIAILSVLPRLSLANPLPGDLCTVAQTNATALSGGIDNSGVAHLLLCNGTTWQQLMTWNAGDVSITGSLQSSTESLVNGASYFSTDKAGAEGVLDGTYSSYPNQPIPIIGTTSAGMPVMGTFNDNQGYFAGLIDGGTQAWFGMTYNVTNHLANGTGIVIRDTGIRFNIYGTNAVLISDEGFTEIRTTFGLSGTLTPPQLTANVNNYNPAGLNNANVLRLSSNASRDITGLTAYNQLIWSGRIIHLVNIGTQNIVLRHQNASSTDRNRFAIGSDITLTPDRFIVLMYDSTSQRWRAGI